MEIIIQGAGPSKLFPTPLDFDSFDSVEEVLAEMYRMSVSYGVILYPARVTEDELNDIYTACRDLDKPVTTIENLWTAHEAIKTHGEAFLKFMESGLTADHPDDWENAFENAFRGLWDSKGAFAENHFSEVNSEIYEGIQSADLPVDWEDYADTMEMNGQLYFVEAGPWGGQVYVFDGDS